MSSGRDRETGPGDNIRVSDHRDDLDTLEPSDSDSRTGIVYGTVLEVPSSSNCRMSSICQSVEPNKRKDAEAGDEDEAIFDESDCLNDTRMDLEDERLDLNSVLSGTMNGDEKDTNDVMQDNDFTKNLSRLFEDNDEIYHSAKQDDDIAAVATVKPGLLSRPPLAPLRTKDDNLKSTEGISSIINSEHQISDDKLLSVFCRIRPPVSAGGKEGYDGCMNTIEIITNTTTGQPITIRTYPPLTSNAAKVVRAGNRPATADSKLKKALSSKSLTEERSSDSGADRNAEVRGVKEFSYCGVFGPNSTQSEVYDNVAAPLVEGLLPKDKSGELGESALLFTLGVTNAGKTHTVMGTGFDTKRFASIMSDKLSPSKNWGIIPRSLHHILSRINALNDESTSGPKLQLYMSYLEIYNEQIFDLLPNSKQAAPRRPCDGPTALKLRESRRGRIFVRGLERHPINNVHYGLQLAQEAKNNRHTASNNINANSSRSHSICQLEISHFRPTTGTSKVNRSDTETGSDYDTDDDSSVCSRSSTGSKKLSSRTSTIIWIVDLAGSERSKRTTAVCHTRHQKEAALINASLMNLMRCLREMINHQTRKRGTVRGGVVPFRESKLTHMFMNHLTGPSASRTSMIVNVNPAAEDFDETQHVLSYATTARNVQISAVDYNRKRLLLAKESSVKLSPVKKIAKLVQKLSPKKRKVTAESKPVAKRPRTNNDQKNNETKAGETVASRKCPDSADSLRRDGTGDLEQLREENFSLKITVDDLQQQLANCEADVRQEVVEMMTEQLQESKDWYEGRITNLKEQISILQSTNSKKSQGDAQERIDDLLDRINECEDEMKRMREDHESEMEEKTAELLNLANVHEAEVEKLTLIHEEELRKENDTKESLTEEKGALQHQNEELRTSNDALLSKFNELVARHQSTDQVDSEDSYESNDDIVEEKHEGESIAKSQSFKKLPRVRCSDVASTAAPAETVTSPKAKRGNWAFLRSQEKGTKSTDKTNKRSPLGELNV